MAAKFTTPEKQLTWLITGCSSGFGLSLARFAQADGHKVIASSRNPSRTPELVTEIESKGGSWIQLDVDSPDSAKVIVNLENSGHEIDVLVNNAGYCIFAAVEASSDANIRSQMETLYFGPLRLIRATLPCMRKRRFGIIANISSAAALDGVPSMGPYAGAKAGLDGVTRILAKEVAPYNVRVLTVMPGTFNTSFGNKAQFSKTALPDDYQGSAADETAQALAAGKITPNGDTNKAMAAAYEVIVGEGRGSGHEAERFLPLGTDATARMKGVQEYYAHAMEVFGHITNDVGVDK